MLMSNRSCICVNFLNHCSGILYKIVANTQKVVVRVSIDWDERALLNLIAVEQNHFSQMRSKIRRLPTIHRETLRTIVEHLARVAARSEKNKMDIKNLAIVFSNVIFGEEEIPKGVDLLSVQHVNVCPPILLA